ncbi:FAD-binding protein [Microbacterium sp. P05]|uniref:FAD-binding protein n=1 Tax=Microbacterium sp. P05 TaxID=3366948 RepID=UPI003744B48B
MLFDAGTDEYVSATRPDNSATTQRPARVAVIVSPADISTSLAEVAALSRSTGRDLGVVVQATGHGAGAPVGENDVLFDTSGLNGVSIDPESRVATVGAGATWGAVNAVAEKHGLLGLAGSSPTVSVSGYTFAGGIGWLVRRDGLASSSLRRVHYVDGSGRHRIAADDAAEQIDRDAIWAFRGAGGVGIASALEFDLEPVSNLHAGLLLWHASALPELVSAWKRGLESVGQSVASSIAVIHVPPVPPFPKELHGSVAIHLAIADPDGPDGAAPLLDAMRAAATPVVDDWGPKDAAGLARIHLDPPTASPAVGDARWLDSSTPDLAERILTAAAAKDSPLVMVEIRHVAGAPTRREGAVVSPPGPFVYHGVGSMAVADRPRIEAGLEALRTTWQDADTGVAPGSWLEGAAAAPSALRDDVLERARVIADRVDPDRLIRRSRLLSGGQTSNQREKRPVMKAVRFHEFGGPEVLRYEDADQPVAGEGQVLIRVAGSAFNPADSGIRSGTLPFPVSLPHVPGYDVSGTIAALGTGVTDFQVGDAVVGFIPMGADGSAAQYVVAPADVLAVAPSSIDLSDAAALPSVALTAWQALFDLADLKDGQRLLITGAGGSVGGYAIQLAKRAGAYVIATASPRSRDSVTAAGADEVIDHTSSAVLDSVHEPVDVLLNLAPISPEEFAGLVALVRDGGIVVSTTAWMTTPGDDTRGVRTAGVFVEAKVDELSQLVALVDSGELTVNVAQRVPLRDLREIHEKAAAGELHGKVVASPEAD